MLGLGGLMLWLTFRGMDLSHIWEKIKNARFGWVFLSAVFSFIAFISRAYRWNMLLEPAGYKPLLKNTSYAVMFAYLANLAFPRLGEVTRCGALSKKEKIPFDILFGTVIVERVLDVLSLFIAIGIVSLLEFNTMGKFIYDNFLVGMAAKFTIVNMLIVLSAAVASTFVIIRIIKDKSESGFIFRFKKLLGGIGTGLKSILKIKNLPLFIFHSIFIWVMYYLMIYACFFSMDATSALGVRQCFLILVVGGLAMSAPVQGGVGLYHLFVSSGLALYGVPLDDGVAFATLLHTSQIIEIVLCGVVALILLGVSKDRDSKMSHAK